MPRLKVPDNDTIDSFSSKIVVFKMSNFFVRVDRLPPPPLTVPFSKISPMSPFAGRFWTCLCVSVLLVGCQKTPAAPSKPPSPSTVTGAVKEDQLTTVELTEAAERRLGIEVVPIEMRDLPRYRVYGGEVVVPTGATVIVSAPITGRLQSPPSKSVPNPGSAVSAKQTILGLIPVLSAAEKIGLATQLADAEGLVEQAQSQVDANRIDLKRAEQQAEKGVGLGKTLDDAKAKLIISQKALDAAISRQKVLADVLRDGRDSSNEDKPVLIDTPQSGILRALHALPDELVTAGSPLFEVIKTDLVWVRVPVYVGDVSEIAIDQGADVGDLSWRAGQPLTKVQPIAAPPTATALSSTVDLYYQMPNPEGKFRPNQRVSVQLPLGGQESQRVVPWSAVVQDINGGSWVYEKVGDHKFARRRVQVKHVVDQWAVLEQGPPVDTKIVVTGVAEMFGTEFGFGK